MSNSGDFGDFRGFEGRVTTLVKLKGPIAGPYQTGQRNNGTTKQNLLKMPNSGDFGDFQGFRARVATMQQLLFPDNRFMELPSPIKDNLELQQQP